MLAMTANFDNTVLDLGGALVPGGVAELHES